MNNIHSLIVEDDAADVKLLQHYIEQLPFFVPPHVATSGSEAFKLLHMYQYDLMFLDMKLPDINGKTLLETLTRRPAVVVTTASASYATDCYDLDVVDYLVKPFEFTRFLRAVNRAVSHTKIYDDALVGSESVYLKVGRKMQQFAYKDIDYIEAYGVYSKIWQHGQVTVINESLGNLEERLLQKNFLRIHKSYLVNASKIVSFDHGNVEVNQFKIQIGVSYKSRVRALTDLINKK
jgi:DNA-binding LytR/AlgR family response regulator